MNKKWKGEKKKSIKNSPVLFDDEEMGTSSSDEVKTSKSSATPNSKSYTDHSTPIRDKCKTDSSDSPDLNYNESPIEPLTQHPPNEVGWDYQRLVSKEEGVKPPITMDISKTPKRSVFLSKKRNSNSPLLYKPLKKKLIQEEQQEHMAGFMEELKAIEIRAKKIGEMNVEVQKIDNELESQLIVEIDSQPSDDSDIKLQVSANTDESPGQSRIVAVNKNYDALLDDSIEDIMVQCSQEVEAKEYGTKNLHPLLPQANKLAEKTFLTKCSNMNLERIPHSLFKENVQPSNSNKEADSDTSSKNSSISNKAEAGSLEIPDDSFDDFFVGFDENDFCKNVNTEIIVERVNKPVNTYSKSMSGMKTTISASKTSNVQNKFFQSKNSSNIIQSKVGTTTSINYVNSVQDSNALVQSKVVNTNANFGYLNKDYVRSTKSSGFYSQSQASNNVTGDKTSNSRLFKAKSFSDSNFLQQRNSVNNFTNNYRSSSNLNINSMIQRGQQNSNSVNQNTKSTLYTAGSSTESKGWRRVHSSSSLGQSSTTNSSQQSSVNKLNNVEGSQSTPEEIERKRQEAIMKREAKLRMKFNNTALRRPIQHSVKR